MKPRTARRKDMVPSAVRATFLPKYRTLIRMMQRRSLGTNGRPKPSMPVFNFTEAKE
jgi:hypothetical protein